MADTPKTPAAEMPDDTGPDYRDTLFLPQTDFPMKAGLPQREPEWLAGWNAMDLYGKLRTQSKGREPFTLHDGPPYANGHIHMGTAMQKVLKDMVVRSHQMMGRDAAFVPGWDCHGLPIEWKVEQRYREAGKSKDEVPVTEFRKECRDFAQKWIDIQREEFKRLGVMGDWDNPYTTMAYDAEARIAQEFMKFVMDGSLYLGSKPVMWSVVERTALAEAEVEYHEKKSPTIWVKFPVVDGHDSVKGASIVIWTTTPWTIPGNRAVCFSHKIPYGAYRVETVAEGALAREGDVLILADALAAQVATDAKIETLTRLHDADPKGATCRHPLWGLEGAQGGYDFTVPLLDGDHVTDEAGTGFVHTAPGHGQDDYEVATLQHGIEVPHTVGEDGTYFPGVPFFAGKTVFTSEGKDGDANGAVIKALITTGSLLTKGSLRHSYPHSWRSKAPVIFRNTPQWFVSMEKTGLREKALKAIDEVTFVPEQGRNRIRSMVEGRPDWVLSRQRAWGVPLTVFYNKDTQELLRDEAVNARIAAAFREEGADAWFNGDPKRFLGDDHDPEQWEPARDILDVWFDSGSTHAFVLEDREDLHWPADLYLEGSDQHRGWFQSSLLESCGTRGTAPYRAVLTHGFLVDDQGRKMSKSLGNVIEPQQLIDQYGADTIRLWVSSADFTEDLRLGKEVIKGTVDAYRKLRNTMRFLLGALHGFTEEERLPAAEMPPTDRWVLHRIAELDGEIREAYAGFDFNRVYQNLLHFCNNDLSAFYFDIRKDSLYCDRPDATRRRACRTVMDAVFNTLTVWFAPILCFTMEEVWRSRHGEADNSVHLRIFPEIPSEWRDDALAARWAAMRKVRRVVTGALEVERREGRIGSSLEAAPVIHVLDADLAKAIEGLDMAELAITSSASVTDGEGPETAFRLEDVSGVAVEPRLAEGRKCRRSWKILPEVGTHPTYKDLTLRDADAVEALVKAGKWSVEGGKKDAPAPGMA